MRFTPDNFLYLLKQLVVGSSKKNADGSSAADGGYNQDYGLALGDASLATGATITTDAAGLHVLHSAATNTLIGTFGWQIPRDYDQNTDKLIVRFAAAMGGATNTPAITVASSTQALSTATAYGALVAGSTAVTGALNNTMTVYEVDLSNQGLVRDTLVSLTLTAGAHTTDAINIYWVEIVYASCLVAFADATNTAGKSVGYDALGNPLR